jgi:hypothetical protein
MTEDASGTAPAQSAVQLMVAVGMGTRPVARMRAAADSVPVARHCVLSSVVLHLKAPLDEAN